MKSMNELNFIFASNDGITLTSGHFGDAENYYAYKILEHGVIKFDGIIENEFKDTDESTAHGSKQKRQSIISSLSDSIDFIVASHMSPNFNKINANTKICPIVSEITNIDECLAYLKSNSKAIYAIKKSKSENKTVEIIHIKKTNTL